MVISKCVPTIPAVERELSVPRKFMEVASPRKHLFDGPIAVLLRTRAGSRDEVLGIGRDAGADAFKIVSSMSYPLGALCNFDLVCPERGST